MSEKFELFPNQTIIEGAIASLEVKPTKAGGQFAVLRVKKETEYKGKKYGHEYEIAAFSKAFDEGVVASGVKEGDHIQAKCWVQSSEYKGRWFLKLTLISLTITQVSGEQHKESAPADTTAADMAVPEEDAGLPF